MLGRTLGPSVAFLTMSATPEAYPLRQPFKSFRDPFLRLTELVVTRPSLKAIVGSSLTKAKTPWSRPQRPRFSEVRTGRPR